MATPALGSYADLVGKTASQIAAADSGDLITEAFLDDRLGAYVNFIVGKIEGILSDADTEGLVSKAQNQTRTGTLTQAALLSFSGSGHAGVRLNNLTTAQRDALTPSAGDFVFNTTTNVPNFYNGSAWATSADGGAAASLNSSIQAAAVISPYNTGAGQTGEARFLELAANGTDYVSLKAPDGLAATIGFTLPTALPSTNGEALVSSTAGVLSFTAIAPAAAQYVTLATDASLTSERTLAGTTNQITITDGGAGNAVTLSTPQDLHTGATPQFTRMGLGLAADATSSLAIGQSSILAQELGSAPATPATGNWRAYFKSDGLYIIDDAGAETNVSSGGIAAGTATNNTLRWNGSAWVESTAFTNDDTNVVTTGGLTLATNFRSSASTLRLHVNTSTEAVRYGATSNLYFTSQQIRDSGEFQIFSGTATTGAGGIGVGIGIQGPASSSTNAWVSTFGYEGLSTAQRVAGIRADGHTHIGNIGANFPTTRLHVHQDDAGTADIVNTVTVSRGSTGTAADGFGASIVFTLDDDAGAQNDAARIGGLMTDVSAGSFVSALNFYTSTGGAAPAERMRITGAGDVLIGTTTAPSANNGSVMVFGDNTADPTMGSNTAGVYGKDVAGTVELFAVDEAANATQLSPHDDEGNWVYHSYNLKTRRRVVIEMEKMMVELQKLLNKGKKADSRFNFIHETEI